jgi:hypothetical protein
MRQPRDSPRGNCSLTGTNSWRQPLRLNLQRFGIDFKLQSQDLALQMVMRTLRHTTVN